MESEENDMGLYIPNMKMPECCVKCHWYYELYDEHCTLGKFLLRKYPTDVSEEPYILDTQRHPDCPLEEIDDIQYEAFIEFSKLLLQRIEENLLHGEKRNDEEAVEKPKTGGG